MYRHTQIGWMTIATFGVIGVIFYPLCRLADHPPLTAFMYGLLGLLLALFATLTVTVDGSHLRFAFGIGLIRKTIALSEVRHFRAVRNHWYWGWGIRFYPGGMLYNVSGLDAVEIVTSKGKRLRIGTDQPTAVCRALEGVLGPPPPLSPEELVQARRRSRRLLLVLATVVVAVFAAIGALFWAEEQQPTAVLDGDVIRIASFIYSTEVPLTGITALTLEEGPPPVELKTNGYALGGTLRGWFRVRGLGTGLLFIEIRQPPFVLIRTGEDFVAVGFDDPEATRALFSEFERAWRDQR